MTNNEILEESWFKFKRHYYKEGFIDIYIGDQAHDPNLSKKPYFSLNTPCQWIRANGKGRWYCVSKSREEYGVWSQFKDLTADEILEVFKDE